MTLDAGNSAYLEAVGRDLEVAARRYALVRRRRRTRVRIAALALTAAILLTGTALAGSSLLGMPAPGIVQSALDAVWPSDDTSDLRPVAGTAQMVAQSEHATLYRSRAKRPGAVCLSVVSGTDRATGCMDRLAKGDWALPLSSHTTGTRQVVFGQLHNPAGVTLVLQWTGGKTTRIVLGVDGFFVADLPLAKADRGAAPETISLRIVDGDGFVIGQRDFPRFRVRPAKP